jgi:SEC-C motif-containing protein
MMNTTMIYCPCGTDRHYSNCCSRYLDHGEIAATAESLMRSRYTAYTLNREDYLLSTWHHKTRPISIELTNQSHQWLSLIVKRYEQSSSDHAIVEFVARYKINGRAYRLHEISQFVRESGRWFYVDGNILQN